MGNIAARHSNTRMTMIATHARVVELILQVLVIRPKAPGLAKWLATSFGVD